jgi:hypothetical protein
MAHPTRRVAPTTRRALLGGLAAGTLLTAGCSTEAEGPPDGTVHLFNQTNFEKAVDVRVAAADGESLLDRTFTVPSGSRETSAVVMPAAGEYRVRAAVDGDSSERTLRFPAAEDGSGVRGYIRVAVSRDGVLVSRAGLR